MIKFSVQASDLVQALDVVGIVPPQEVTKQGGAGYLFVIRGDQSCYIYSQDKTHIARAVLPISNVEGEGTFIYPGAFSNVFKHVSPEETLNFEAGERDGSYYVNYETASGSVCERPSFDPQAIRPVEDPESKEADIEMPAALLKRAIETVRGSLASLDNQKVDEYLKTIQIFDTSKPEWEQGDGTLFAADGRRGSYFYCEAFKGKGLALHGNHLPQVLSFLSKSEGSVILRAGDNWTFLTNTKGQTFGWAHHAKSHPRYAYYPEESIRLLVDTDFLIRQLRYMKEALEAGDKNKERVRIIYEAAPDKWQLQFLFQEPTGTVKSPYITVRPETEEARTRSFATNISIRHFLDLVSSLESKQTAIGVKIAPATEKRKEGYYFRVIEPLYVDPATGKVLPGPEGGIRCQVTRFIPSMT